MMDAKLNLSAVKQQLAGKRILVTGTTGFLAKVLLEKLIRDVPEIREIILLIRGSDAHPSSRDRFQHEILHSSIFKTLRHTDPVLLGIFCDEKIRCITGEVTEPNFGLTVNEFNKLASKVDIVVNAAASVNFREELDQALKINTLCLLTMTKLVKLAGNIPMIQVSTCYVNGYNRGEMYEENVSPAGKSIPRNELGFYEVQSLIAELQIKIEKIKEAHQGDKKSLSNKLIDLGIQEANRYGWNDTYTFTKWMGEQIVMRELQDGTLTIVRPSVIASTLRDPIPGWIEGIKVSDAIVLAYARRKVSFFPAKTDGVVDIIPVDMVANGIVLAMAETFLAPKQQRIYQCCSGSRNPLVVGPFIGYTLGEVRQNFEHYEKLCQHKQPGAFHAVNREVFLAAMFIVELMVGFVSRISKLFGARGMLKITEALNVTHNLSVIYSFYTSPHYIFHSDKLLALADRLNEADRQMFPVDTKIINWPRYICEIHVPSLNKYGMRDRRKVNVPGMNVYAARERRRIRPPGLKKYLLKDHHPAPVMRPSESLKQTQGRYWEHR
jgi:fatty acyl-CoA reductase